MDSSPSFTSTPLRRIELTPAPDGPNPIATLPVTKTDKRKYMPYVTESNFSLGFIELLEELRTKAEVEGGTCGYPFVSNSYVAPTDEMFDSDGNLLYVPDITGIMIQQHSGKSPLSSCRLLALLVPLRRSAYSRVSHGKLAGCRWRNHCPLRRETGFREATVF